MVEDRFVKGLKAGLLKTRGVLTGKMKSLISRRRVSNDLIEGLEEVLITADIGVETTAYILERIKKNSRGASVEAVVVEDIKGCLLDVLRPLERPLQITTKPYCIMFVGVNGVGKTTVVGRLAHRFKKEGKSLLLAASDTFRAAAVEQLEEWGKRVGADVIKHDNGGDPAAVAFDAVKIAASKGIDVLMVDTGGRVHTKANLMEELKKVKRVMDKALSGAPHEIILCLDATTGQNALLQASSFHSALGVTGIVLTKLDGTAKGGILVAIGQELKIPIRFIGIGEDMNGLVDFNAREFVEALV